MKYIHGACSYGTVYSMYGMDTRERVIPILYLQHMIYDYDVGVPRTTYSEYHAGSGNYRVQVTRHTPQTKNSSTPSTTYVYKYNLQY